PVIGKSPHVRTDGNGFAYLLREQIRIGGYDQKSARGNDRSLGKRVLNFPIETKIRNVEVDAQRIVQFEPLEVRVAFRVVHDLIKRDAPPDARGFTRPGIERFGRAKTVARRRHSARGTG